jgi:excinuclease UvrABC helicase subunit UvrB
VATVEIDSYMLDVLLADLVGHDRAPSAFLVYIWLVGQAARNRSGHVEVSYQDMAVRTGLSRSAVQAAVKRLKARRLLQAEQTSLTATPVYRVLRPWHRPR